MEKIKMYDFLFLDESVDLLDATMQLEAFKFSLPKDIEDLLKKVKEKNNESFNKHLKNKKFSERVKVLSDKRKLYETIITDSLKISGINILNMYEFVTTMAVNGVYVQTIENIAICAYKDYILRFHFNEGVLPTCKIGYDPNECSIPKNIVFEIVSNVKNINKCKYKENSFTIASNNRIEDSYVDKLNSKYEGKYKIKKNIGGSLTISNIDKK